MAALKTTRETLEQYTRGISLAAFLETLCDVILFAWAISFCYLWIDALCIIWGNDLD